jgi:hypothetical protein
MADSNDNPDNKAPENTPKPAKKPYKKPELMYWGSLEEITKSGGKASLHSDNGTKFGNKQTS